MLEKELDPEVWQTQAHSAQYNAARQLTSWKEGTGWYSDSTLTRTYSEPRGWLTQLTAADYYGTRLNLSYSYYPNGRVQAVTDAVNPAQSATYGYDQLNRLTSASASGWGLAWTYDDFGNRLTQAATLGAPPTSTLAYDETTNRITTAGHSYDANGNLTAMPGKTMTYDVFDRLATINVSGTVTTAKYDAYGRRIERSLPDGTKRLYFYDLSGRLLAEYDTPANYSTGDVWYGLASPVRMQRYFAGQRIGQWTDRRGDVRFATGSGWKHYYPYGEEITSTTNDTYKFAQLYRDGDTIADYAIHRYLVPTIGRFATPDPSQPADPADPGSWNLYSYVQGDPLNFIDPEGLVKCGDWSVYEYGYVPLRVVLSSSGDVPLLAKLVWAEADPRWSRQGTAGYFSEMNAIAWSVINRWRILHGLTRIPGVPPSTLGWGPVNATIKEIIGWPGQYATIVGGPQNPQLKDQAGLNAVLNSEPTANNTAFWPAAGGGYLPMTHECYQVWASLTAAYLAFSGQSSDPIATLGYTTSFHHSSISRSPQETTFGGCGSANIFYGIPYSRISPPDWSPNLPPRRGGRPVPQ
jgi:RHS repeat-associated protein